jgi:hypothetical protein
MLRNIWLSPTTLREVISRVGDRSARAKGGVSAAWYLCPVIALALFLGIACVQVAPTIPPTPTPTPTPMPTPTPTPMPTPTPTPALSPLPEGSAPPLVEFEPDFSADPDPEKLDQMLRLVGKLPAGYSRMVVVDVKELNRSAALAQAVDLGELGLPRMLQLLLTHALDLVVLAVPDDVNGGVVVFQGEVDLGSMVALASGLGLSIDPEPEIYQGHRRWSGQIFGTTALSLAELGGNIGVIAQGPATDPSVPEQLVKDVLDGADGPTPVLPGGPEFRGLVGKLPSGTVTVLVDECRSPASNITQVGCASAAMTVIEASEGQVLAHLVLGFGTEAQAEVALPVLREGLANSELDLREIAVRQEGTLLRARMVGNTQEILTVLTGEN